MRHSVFGSKLSRNAGERKRLFTVLVRDFITHDVMVTSLVKAKTVQPIIEKLVTRAKAGGDINKRRIMAVLGDRELTNRLIDEAKTRFANRTSGFTRLIKVGKRMGDSTDTAQLSFVDARVITEVIAPKKETNKEAKEVKKEKKEPVKKAPVKPVKKSTKK